MGNAVSNAKYAALTEGLDQFSKGEEKIGKIVGKALVGAFQAPPSTEKLKTSTKAKALRELHQITNDKLEAMCAIQCSALYLTKLHVVLMKDCYGNKATSFYTKKEDMKEQQMWAYVPDGTHKELLHDIDEFKKAGPDTPIQIRHLAVPGFVKKKHIQRDFQIEGLQDALSMILDQDEYTKLKPHVKILYAQALEPNSLVNAVGVVIVEMENERFLIIGWAGTDVSKRPMDLLTDVGATPAANVLWHDKMPRIHGHASISAVVQGQFTMYKKRIIDLLTMYKCGHLVFTGHSLGAGCCFTAHMCALCQAEEFAGDGPLAGVDVKSFGFAGPMVFYENPVESVADIATMMRMEERLENPNGPDNLSLLKQEVKFMTGEDVEGDKQAVKDFIAKVRKEKTDRMMDEEKQIRESFASNSVNYVVDMDPIPRLPGVSSFYGPALREVFSSLGSSHIVSKVDADVASAVCKKIVGEVGDMILSHDTVKRTQDDLARYAHFSRLWYVEPATKSFWEKTNEEFRDIPFKTGKDELSSWEYIIGCHTWLPRSCRFDPEAASPSCNSSKSNGAGYP